MAYHNQSKTQSVKTRYNQQLQHIRSDQWERERERTTQHYPIPHFHLSYFFSNFPYFLSLKKITKLSLYSYIYILLSYSLIKKKHPQKKERRNIETTHTLHQETKEESTFTHPTFSLYYFSFSLYNGPAGPKFMYWRRKNKRYRERRRKERRRERCLHISSNHTHLTHTKKETIFISCFHKYPSAIPQKIPHLHHFTVSKEQCFSPIYVGFLGFVLVRVFTEKTLISLSHLSFSLYSFFL